MDARYTVLHTGAGPCSGMTYDGRVGVTQLEVMFREVSSMRTRPRRPGALQADGPSAAVRSSGRDRAACALALDVPHNRSVTAS